MWLPVRRVVEEHIVFIPFRMELLLLFDLELRALVLVLRLNLFFKKKNSFFVINVRLIENKLRACAYVNDNHSFFLTYVRKVFLKRRQDRNNR